LPSGAVLWIKAAPLHGQHPDQIKTAYSEAAQVDETAVLLGFHCPAPAPRRRANRN
jgi:hypothetical protein